MARSRVLLTAADRAEPGFARAFIDAVLKAKSGVSANALAAALAQGNEAEAYRLASAAWDRAMPSWRVAVARDVRQALEVGAEAAFEATAQITGRFDVVNPEAVRFADTRSAALVRDVSTETKAAIRAVVRQSVAEGRSPSAAAKAIREVVGLTTKQQGAVMHFRASLDALRAREAGAVVTTALGRIANRNLTQRLDSLVLRYAQKLLMARALLIARTEIMAAENEGQRQLWQQAAAAGEIDPRRMEQQWLTADDERRCAICEGLDQTRAPIGGQFPSPGGDGPPAHPACRCTVGLVRVARSTRRRARTMPEGGSANWPAAPLLIRPPAPAPIAPVLPQGATSAAARVRAARAARQRGELALRPPPRPPAPPPVEPPALPRIVAPEPPPAGRPGVGTPSAPLSAADSPAQTALSRQRVVNTEHLGGGIHETEVGTLDSGTKVVLKPASSQGNYEALKEVAGYDVAEEVGMTDLVPVTTLVNYSKGPASAMEFVEGYTPAYKAKQYWENIDRNDLWRARVFDHVLRNSDRHNGNWMIRPDGKIKLIDHGFLFRGDRWEAPNPTGPVPASIVNTWKDAKPRIRERLRARGIREADIEHSMERLDKLEAGKPLRY